MAKKQITDITLARNIDKMAQLLVFLNKLAAADWQSLALKTSLLHNTFGVYMECRRGLIHQGHTADEIDAWIGEQACVVVCDLARRELEALYGYE